MYRMTSSPAPEGPRPRRLKELTPPEVAATLASDPRLIVPVGTCEQHGPHLPFGCDTIIVERLADDLSAQFGVLRAPAVEYGVNTPVEREIPGNASMRKKTLHRMLNDLLGAWESCGIAEFVLLTAHRYDPHLEALATVITSRARIRVVDAFTVDVSDLIEGQAEPMHGDEVDTSLLLYLAPHLVRVEAAEDYMVSRDALRRFRRGRLRLPRHGPGSIGRPRLASAQKGEAIYARMLGRIGERVLASPGPPDD
jgi:creatinine amidohydrolase